LPAGWKTGESGNGCGALKAGSRHADEELLSKLMGMEKSA
jgi:hypothetical protein